MDKLFNTKKATSARKPSVQIPVGLEKVEARMIPNPTYSHADLNAPLSVKNGMQLRANKQSKQ
jgi:hypothetical protein